MVQGVIPCIFYLYIFEKIKQRSKGNIVDKKETLTYMYEWKIPKKMRPLILKELEMLGLVENVDCRHIKLNNSTFNEKEINKFYEKLGIF